LKPNGEKRHPFSFQPFLGGRRICLGKTFAEVVAKFIIPAFLCRMDFEMADSEIQKGIKPKPNVHIMQEEDPVIMMKVTRADLSKF
jgi:cytochrome P450